MHGETTRLCVLLLCFVIIEHKWWYFTENVYILLNEQSAYSSLKSSLQAGQLIEHTAQRPDVTLLVVGLSFTQLWRNVAWGPNHLSEKKKNHIPPCWMSKTCPTTKVKTYIAANYLDMNLLYKLYFCWQGFWRCQNPQFWQSFGVCPEEYSVSSGLCARWICCERGTRPIKSGQRNEGLCLRLAVSYIFSGCNPPRFHLHREITNTPPISNPIHGKQSNTHFT